MSDTVLLSPEGVVLQLWVDATPALVHEREPVHSLDDLVEVPSWTVFPGMIRQEDGTFVAPPPSPPPVPQSVSPLQARRALRAAGLYDAVVAAVENSTDPDVKDSWEYATEWRRTDSHVIALATQLGLTESQLDDLFILASTL